jgi:hypothetical protein
VDSMEINFIRRYLKEAIDFADKAGPEEETDELEYFNADDCGFFNQSTILFTNNYLDLINSSRKYINRMRCSFETLGEKICHCLCLNKLKKAETFATTDSLFLYAFYLDPDEKFFLSPVEFMSLEADKMDKIGDVFKKL